MADDLTRDETEFVLALVSVHYSQIMNRPDYANDPNLQIHAQRLSGIMHKLAIRLLERV